MICEVCKEPVGSTYRCIPREKRGLKHYRYYHAGIKTCYDLFPKERTKHES